MRFTIPLKIPSVANLRECWQVKAKRTKAQRKAAMLRCPRWPGGPLLKVYLVRCAPRELDSDNLASALKAVRDGIASRLGMDDKSPLVSWHYGQQKAETGKEQVDVTVLPAGVKMTSEDNS